MGLSPETYAAALCALITVPLLATLAIRGGWVDDRSGELAARKPRRAPVPPIGGVALLFALGAAEWIAPTDLPWIPVLLALGLGLVDDLRRGGLGPGAKFCGQLVVAGAFTAQVDVGLPAAATLLLVLVAMNAVNTWDNADGAAGGLGVVALLPAPAAGAAAGFLVGNLRRVEREVPGGGRERVPVAYLGDAGSHLLGVLVAAEPSAWPVLAVPLTDLARLVIVRARRGRPAWSGDRLHLAHRLQASGLGPLAVALALSLPVLLVRGLSERVTGPLAAAGVGALAVVILAALTPSPQAPCPGGDLAR